MRVARWLLLPVVLVIVASSSITFHAQQTAGHPVTFAELTYGNTINAMAADGSGGVWFGGYTDSTTLPTTSNAVQRTWPGPEGLPVSLLGHMRTDGAIDYLSYFGGSGRSTIAALAVGPAWNLYVAGWTYSLDLPVTPGAFQSTCHGNCDENNDGFVAELSPNGDRIAFATYLGGGGGRISSTPSPLTPTDACT